ncbi:ABC transporter permease [Rhizobium sp. CNPSo 3968]|uniref:ABC transporter permease n=1 Tax=Rhizobium sp. CNPSo 3968 TaxID=3021408 RepID=UPI00254C7923|nr:ABC transporter permease [Rhizobium sp. CNPSo 3968]MDK4717885.1 ABC transporter permease [Rhizobium sp. CNPSo 3968]
MKERIFGTRTKIIIGGSILASTAMAAIFAPYVAPYDPFAQNLLRRLKPPAFMEGGSFRNILGTDNYGRDVLSRLIYGARTSISVGLAAMILSFAIGTLAGLIAGFKGGRVEQFIMRFADAHMAFPDILFAIIMAAAIGGGTLNLVIVLGISGWMIYARLVFGMARSIKQRSFVEAAVSYGGSDRYIMFQHILPQIIPVLAVVATLQVAQMILQEAALSFLGLGLPPPAATWGNILSEGRERLFAAPWIANCAGIAIIIVVFSINMLGNGLREYLDPKEQSR